MGRKKPSALTVPQFSNRSARSGPGDDHGAPSHFAIPIKHRTGGSHAAAFLADIKQTAPRSTRKRILGQLSAPVPGARAARRLATLPVDDDKNGRSYVRALHCLEVLHKRAAITKAEETAGLALSEAYEATLASSGTDYSRTRVDVSRRIAGAEGKADVMRRFEDMIRIIPAESRAACRHVCIEGLALRDGFSRDGHDMRVHLGQLRAGLAALADAYARGRLK